MVDVKFYDEIDDRLLKFAVIIAKTDTTSRPRIRTLRRACAR